MTKQEQIILILVVVVIVYLVWFKKSTIVPSQIAVASTPKQVSIANPISGGATSLSTQSFFKSRPEENDR